MKNKTKLVTLATFSLAMAGPVSATTLVNPVIPLHHSLKASSTPSATSNTLPAVHNRILSRLPVRAQLPDITSHGGPRIGGKYVPWGGRVTLGRHNATRIQNGQCVFQVSYPMSDDSKVSTPVTYAFTNRLYDGDMPAAVNSGLQLNAGQTKYIVTEPNFLPGTHVLRFSLDDGNMVKESNEHNNLFYVTVTVNNSCQHNRNRLPDITSHGGPRIGGKYVPWGGSITLGRHNAVRIQNGQCVFQVSYPMSNDSKVSTPVTYAFTNRLYDGNMLAAVNSGLQLNADETKHIVTEPNFLPGTHMLRLSLDAGNLVKESNEHNNQFHVTVHVDKSCQRKHLDSPARLRQFHLFHRINRLTPR